MARFRRSHIWLASIFEPPKPPDWRPIPYLSGYFATETGEIVGPRGKLTLIPRRSGYLICQAAGKQHRVNRLVCMAFHGYPPTPQHQAAHIDNRRANNRPDNLRWLTPAENAAETAENGSLKGAKHGRASFTEDQIRHIRELRELGYSIVKIREYYSHVCYSTLSHIVNKRNWRHI